MSRPPRVGWHRLVGRRRAAGDGNAKGDGNAAAHRQWAKPVVSESIDLAGLNTAHRVVARGRVPSWGRSKAVAHGRVPELSKSQRRGTLGNGEIARPEPHFFVFVPVATLHLRAGLGYDETRWAGCFSTSARRLPAPCRNDAASRGHGLFWLGLPACLVGLIAAPRGLPPVGDVFQHLRP